jgi:hypothetical protein
MVHTHELTFTGSLLVKRYASWDRGEHRREWAVLCRVHERFPDLGPRPVSADLDADPPTITMSVVAGTALTGAVSKDQLDGLGVAITTLWQTPLHGFAAIGAWADDLGFARQLTDGPRPAGGAAAQAYDAAVAWWNGPDPALLACPPRTMILGHRDPNLANYLWDGQRMRIVDFEDAALSDPATELALLMEHLSAREVDSDRLRARFAVDEARLRAARRLWAMFWLRRLLPGGPSARRNPAGAAELQAQRLLNLLHPSDGSRM